MCGIGNGLVRGARGTAPAYGDPPGSVKGRSAQSPGGRGDGRQRDEVGNADATGASLAGWPYSTAVTDLSRILLGGAAACCVVLAIVVVAWLHLLPTGSNPVSEGVSAYGAGPFRILYRVQVIATGVASLLLVAALAAVGGPDAPPLMVLALFGASRIAIAGYPTDLAGEPPTKNGLVHILLATVAFLSIAVAAPWLGTWIAGRSDWSDGGPLMAALGAAVAVSVAATFGAGLVPRLRRAFGLVERAVYASMLGWLLAVAALVTLHRV